MAHWYKCTAQIEEFKLKKFNIKNEDNHNSTSMYFRFICPESDNISRKMSRYSKPARFWCYTLYWCLVRLHVQRRTKCTRKCKLRCSQIWNPHWKLHIREGSITSSWTPKADSVELYENPLEVNNTAVYDIERRNWKTELPSWAYGSAVVVSEEFPNQLHVSFRNRYE